MKLTFKVLEVTELNDGDIFYCTPNFEMNEFGPHALITGTDQIFIMDDRDDNRDEDGTYSILVNGGNSIFFWPDDKVVRLGHYSDLVRIIAMVKEGNPNMELGPNDSNTIIDKLNEDFPGLLQNPLDRLVEGQSLRDSGIFDNPEDSESDDDSREDAEDDDIDLPF